MDGKAFNKRFLPTKWKYGLTMPVLGCGAGSFIMLIISAVSYFRGDAQFSMVMFFSAICIVAFGIKTHRDVGRARILKSIMVGKADVKRKSLELI